MNINIKKLSIELYYHPPWPKDKHLFVQLLNQSNFTDDDIIIFAQLYVKYSHIHCLYINELNRYFTYMLTKMQLYSATHLFQKTKSIYKKQRHKL